MEEWAELQLAIMVSILCSKSTLCNMLDHQLVGLQQHTLEPPQNVACFRAIGMMCDAAAMECNCSIMVSQVCGCAVHSQKTALLHDRDVRESPLRAHITSSERSLAY